MEDEKFKALLNDCLEEGILGKYTKIKAKDGELYYLNFEFREICDKCRK